MQCRLSLRALYLDEADLGKRIQLLSSGMRIAALAADAGPAAGRIGRA